jgi:hypothetical protein
VVLVVGLSRARAGTRKDEAAVIVNHRSSYQQAEELIVDGAKQRPFAQATDMGCFARKRRALV